MKLPKPESENSNDEISKLEEETDIKKILNINTDRVKNLKKNLAVQRNLYLKI